MSQLSAIEQFLNSCYQYGYNCKVDIWKDREEMPIKTEEGEYELHYSELIVPDGSRDNCIMMNMGSKIALNKLTKKKGDAQIELSIECDSFSEDTMLLKSYIVLPKEVSRSNSTIGKSLSKQGYIILRTFDETVNCYYKTSNVVKAFKHYAGFLSTMSESILKYLSCANI